MMECRDGTGATLVAAHLRELHRSDGGRDEFAATSTSYPPIIVTTHFETPDFQRRAATCRRG